MALPKLLQKLFANGGVGPLLRSDILPIKTVDGYAPDANGNVDTKRFPLAGGALEGNNIYQPNNDGFLSIRGCLNEANSGAFLTLHGKNFGGASKGQFVLGASDGDAEKLLVGLPNGSFTWDGKEVERVNSSGTNWIRYESGLQIVWGNGVSGSNGSYTVSYPVAFIDYPSVLATMVGGADQNKLQVNAHPGFYDVKTSCVFWVFLNEQLVGDAGVLWTAIGRWK